MNLEKVVFGFFIVLAATLNFGFVYGDIDDPAHHDAYELFAVVVVNLIAAVLKFGDRTQIGAVHLATSLVAVLQLVAATLVWFYAVHVAPGELTSGKLAGIVSLSAGALFANVVSVVILVAETVMQRR
jgi:putative Ca2+/H+ antiporter (TMEM165/GDT1 family)